jgi:hypothetical protein
LYITRRKAIKQTVVITKAYHFHNYVQKFIHHYAVKVNSIPEEITGDRQCEFRHHNRPTTDHIFCIRQILEKNCKYNKSSLKTSRKLMIQLEGRSCTVFSLGLVSP